MSLNKIDEINVIEQYISFILIHHQSGLVIEQYFLLREWEQYCKGQDRPGMVFF
jgi:hypothetical protein